MARHLTGLVALGVLLAAAAPALAQAEAGNGDRSARTAPAATQPTTAAATQPATRPADADAPTGPLRTLGRIWRYFGLVGSVSILAWMGVWGVLLAWAIRTPRMRVGLAMASLVGLAVVFAVSAPEVGRVASAVLWGGVFAALAVSALWAGLRGPLPGVFTAVILALLAVGLGMWNSDRVMEFRIDRREEIEAARQRQLAARDAAAAAERGESDVHRADADDANAPGRDANAVGDPDDDAEDQPDYAYRTRGPRQRDANQIDANKPKLIELVDEADEKETRLLLPAEDYVRANRYDTLNRFACRLTLVVALIAAALEYLRRFNRTCGDLLPLPIACRTVDTVLPKSHAVFLQAEEPVDAARRLIEAVVHKGESFLLLAGRDPWPDADRLPRLPRLPLLGRLWPLRKITCTPGDPAYGSRMVFESAWYARYGFVLLADAHHDALDAFLDDLLAMLRMRRRTRASAAKTLHLVWALSELPAPDRLAELADLCREANLTLIVAATTPPPADQADLFDEHCVCEA